MGEGMALQDRQILLIIGGGIAAFKCPDLIRRLTEQGARVRCILTRAGGEFVTPLTLSALTGDKVYGALFDLTDEAEMGHIQLSRDADLVVVAPATADLMAKMAAGLADDLASTALLATDKPVLVAPAMNVRMWEHAATRRNVAQLAADGVAMVGPDEGVMACNEFGMGRMSEPEDIVRAVLAALTPNAPGPLSGLHALVTSGPTHEAIDPVRYIANRSSGKQGHAIAAALAAAGARTTLVSGPTGQSDPAGVTVVHIESARQMLDACLAALPAEIAVCAAAVADWRVDGDFAQKLKKQNGTVPTLAFTENPDILATLAGHGDKRPGLVVGFAAETEKLVEHATQKRARKGCDWILANDVSPTTGTFGGDDNSLHLISADSHEAWPRMTKAQAAGRLAQRIVDHFVGEQP